MRRTILSALTCVSLAACDSRNFFNDEGVWLGQRIGEAAERLRASTDTILMLEYTPREGMDQTYTVGMGISRWCPNPPCDPREQSGLTVSVERGHHGSTTVHKRHVAVPAPLSVTKHGERMNIVLRKNGDVIEVAGIR
jgi:hypothetical protein